MAYTLEQLQKLNEAIAQGVTRVKYADKEVEYRSLADMLQVRRLMMAELGLYDPNAGRILTTFDKGVYKKDNGNCGCN